MNPRLAKVRTLLLAAAVLSSIPISHLQAGSIVNGDFSDLVDLTGWLPSGSVVGEPTGDFAQLDTDGSFLRTLEQPFTLPAEPSLFTFDFAFSTSVNSVPPLVFPDSLSVSLITDGGDALDILLVDLFGAVPDPSDGMEAIVGVLPIDVDLDPSVIIPGFMPLAGGPNYSGRVSLALPAAVLGQNATVYFDLFDEFDGASSIAAIDNMSVGSANAVPVPATLGLLLTGMAAAFVRRHHRRVRPRDHKDR